MTVRLNTASITSYKVADDTTGVGQVTDDDDTVYREENKTSRWVMLNTNKTKELISDFRKGKSRDPEPVIVGVSVVEMLAASNSSTLTFQLTCPEPRTSM